MKVKPILLFVIGTRPEAIKLAPLIIAAKKENCFPVKVCLTAQHRELLDSVIDFFEIEVDIDFNLMKVNQDNLQFMSQATSELSLYVDSLKPSLIIVQGDTTTALVGALVGYYKKIKIAHVEAGLRSFNLNSPFPEEMNRKMIGQMSSFHFAPTELAVNNLKHEGITDQVYLVGNTVIDALKIALSVIEMEEESFKSFFSGIDFNKRIILVTCHRRENFGKPLEEISNALLSLSDRFDDAEIVLPLHPNPNVAKVMRSRLGGTRVKLIEALNYPQLIWIMNQSYLILTDSGGIQEEAPSLGKPVLVLRDTTERNESILAGTAKLIGTKEKNILKETTHLLQDSTGYAKMVANRNPYGNGKSSSSIISILKKELINDRESE